MILSSVNFTLGLFTCNKIYEFRLQQLSKQFHEVLKEYLRRILPWVRAWRGVDAAERWRWGAVSDSFYMAAYGLCPFFRSFSLYKLEIAFARHKVGEGVNMKVF